MIRAGSVSESRRDLDLVKSRCPAIPLARTGRQREVPLVWITPLRFPAVRHLQSELPVTPRAKTGRGMN